MAEVLRSIEGNGTWEPVDLPAIKRMAGVCSGHVGFELAVRFVRIERVVQPRSWRLGWHSLRRDCGRACRAIAPRSVFL
ncbi:hypothetical protein E2562_000284 [Oryza meyeriana var. granulata]|uniref:Uncharacterized protein n=1 Tax=Oryza meyeriana var. granulata TaxID=110450 RepID=A0A6G1CP34_9ORYZ|nr:hypothetical protein E2562_000284 [Oryza meyeriana var. granulata]